MHLHICRHPHIEHVETCMYSHMHTAYATHKKWKKEDTAWVSRFFSIQNKARWENPSHLKCKIWLQISSQEPTIVKSTHFKIRSQFKVQVYRISAGWIWTNLRWETWGHWRAHTGLCTFLLKEALLVGVSNWQWTSMVNQLGSVSLTVIIS